MNWASARSSRASAPFSTTKRAPDSFAAVSKSMRPQRLADLEMLLRLKRELRRRADLAHFRHWRLVVADRHVVERRVGNGREQVRAARHRAACSSASPVWIAPLSAATSSIRRFGCGLVLARPWPGRSPSRRRCGALAPPAISESSRGVARPGSEFDSTCSWGSSKPRFVSPLTKGVLVVANPFDVEHGFVPRLGIEGFRIRPGPFLVIARLDRAIRPSLPRAHNGGLCLLDVRFCGHDQNFSPDAGPARHEGWRAERRKS